MKRKDYKTLEDFEKIEFEEAKKDNMDVEEYEDFILESANCKYWDWVSDNCIALIRTNKLNHRDDGDKYE